jgi:hypothetical protein
VGLLAAVEMWVQREHNKEDETWTQWMQTIADRVTKIDGVTASVRQARGLGSHSPGLSINWDPAKLGSPVWRSRISFGPLSRAWLWVAVAAAVVAIPARPGFRSPRQQHR